MAQTTGTTTENIPLVADPKTLAGQKIGAILSVKHLSARITALKPAGQKALDHVAVWDHIKIEKFQTEKLHDVEGTNLRTGEKVKLVWECFFPLTVGATCFCMGRLPTCFCVIEDPKLYYAYKDLSKNSVYMIRDPATVEGQRYGAILVVKSKPLCRPNQLDVEVGDCVEFISGYPDNAGVIKGRNLKTDSEGKVSWKCFFSEDKKM